MRIARWSLGALSISSLLFGARLAVAGNALQILSANADPPTVAALGVQVLIAGDDNHDATISVRYRKTGDTDYRTGLPLFRVHPEVVTGFSVPEQFAGSVFDLLPNTSYDVELHAVDPDGLDDTRTITMSTRPLPTDPPQPHEVPVTDAASLQAALDAAMPGDIIKLQNGTYAGTFNIHASGTDTSPIVIRGQTPDGAIIDGQGCTGCNLLEVYGSFVHVEGLTLRGGSRALRFQGPGTEGNVVRRVVVRDVVLGFGSQTDQKNFYICDNDLEGRLVWPAVYKDDGGAHANDDGIHVEGNGHVVCHNRLKGFGDAMKIEEDGARANDFYGNEVLSAYDNGVELDASSGNARCFRNRFTNTYATISVQPIFGGPAYVVRNIVVNVANEQVKFHALGTTPPEEPSGIFLLNNTFVSPDHALNLQTSDGTHYFFVENNLFIGPDAPASGKTVDWTGPIDQGVFDHDGYYPEGKFSFNLAGAYQTFPSFSAIQGAGLEAHGLIVGASEFASGLVPPAAYTSTLMPADVTLKAGSLAIDQGATFANVTDDFQGKAPDLGALELGCPSPIYGVRPQGIDESNEPLGCAPPGSGSGGASSSASTGASSGTGTSTGTSGGASGGAGANGGTDSGCGCAVPGSDGSDRGAVALLAVATGVLARRRTRRLG